MGRKKKNQLSEDVEEVSKGILLGFLMTMALIFVVPVVMYVYLAPVLNEIFEGTSIGFITSNLLVTVILLITLLVFMLLLGGGAIFSKYGLFGIIGLVLAYVYVGRPYDCILPIAMILIVMLAKYATDRKRGKGKKKNKKK